jgi:aryl-alcohol dehydrogenase-like predicted oxidoreductase
MFGHGLGCLGVGQCQPRYYQQVLPHLTDATATLRFAARFPALKAAGFYREVQGLTVSNIGIGTYLGEMDAATDSSYTEAVRGGLTAGVNFIDTSLNYRNQRSERSIGAALWQAVEAGEAQREEIVISTKAGYLVPDALPKGILSANDIVAGMHSMAPAFLRDQLNRSRANLGLDAIDVFYLHNPETQLAYISQTEFLGRIRLAFEYLESAVADGWIHYYGTATWGGYRHREPSPEALPLEDLAAIAREIGGQAHHFRFIQLPFNLAMPEAFSNRVNGENVLEVAARLGISVVASASLYQARLSRNLPDEIRSRLPGAETDAQRAIQFVRSTPGIAVALVGMSSLAHVRENLGLASVPPLDPGRYMNLYT